MFESVAREIDVPRALTNEVVLNKLQGERSETRLDVGKVLGLDPAKGRERWRVNSRRVPVDNVQGLFEPIPRRYVDLRRLRSRCDLWSGRGWGSGENCFLGSRTSLGRPNGTSANTGSGMVSDGQRELASGLKAGLAKTGRHVLDVGRLARQNASTAGFGIDHDDVDEDENEKKTKMSREELEDGTRGGGEETWQAAKGFIGRRESRRRPPIALRQCDNSRAIRHARHVTIAFAPFMGWGHTIAHTGPYPDWTQSTPIRRLGGKRSHGGCRARPTRRLRNNDNEDTHLLCLRAVTPMSFCLPLFLFVLLPPSIVIVFFMIVLFKLRCCRHTTQEATPLT